MKQWKLASLALAGLIGLSACTDDSPTTLTAPEGPALAKKPATSAENAYLIQAQADALPPGLQKQIQEAGGTIQSTTPEIGMVVAVSSDPQFAQRVARISGIQSVAPDLVLDWLEPPAVGELIPLEVPGNPPASGSDDFFFDLQWGHDAIDAPEAWAASGEFGAGVRVCVIDSGIDEDHPDLAPNVNTELSRSFVPGESPFTVPGFFFNHGTHVAGTIGAANNSTGTIGVAPEVELVSLRVFSDFGGGAPFSRINEAIVYSATIDCDIVNMSLGGSIPRSVGSAAAELINSQKRAVNFAYQQGVTLIASAGNDGLNRNKTRDLFVLPSDLPHVVSVSAYAPEGWALDPFAPDAIFFVPASYTNYGQRAIDVSAPGGDFDFFFANPDLMCTIVITRACGIFDGVFSTISGGWGWSSGTSMAAPHASGVAALIIGQNGGEMKPAQVISILKRTAEDVGKPGKDAFFGHGTVNAFFAVTGTNGNAESPQGPGGKPGNGN